MTLRVHARLNAESSYYCGEDGDDNLNNLLDC